MAFDLTTITFESGKFGLIFWGSAVGATEKLILKDPTTDPTEYVCFIDRIQMACGTGTVAALYDGSAGTKITPTMCSGCEGGGFYSQTWDFAGDALVLAGNDTTESWLCISAAASGTVEGMIKYHFGFKPN